MLYFHGNGEDLGCQVQLIDLYAQLCDCSVLAVEYPGVCVCVCVCVCVFLSACQRVSG
jgi:hypothetical protein